MLKKIFFVFLCFLIFGCSHQNEVYLCPNISIPRDTAYVTQNNNKDEVYIEIFGYDAYCYAENIRKQTKASVAPLFRVMRKNSSSAQTVYVEYFLKIGESIKTVEESFDMPAGEKQFTFEGKPKTVRIRSFENHSPIFLGLVLSPNEKFYNSQTFDIGFEKIEKSTYANKPTTRKTRINCSSCNL